MILALDPGNTVTGFVLYDGASVLGCGVVPNHEALQLIAHSPAQHMASERIASYGMSVGREIFETCEWVGDFRNEWRRRNQGEAILVYRKDVKLHLCGTPRAKDPNVRQALIDLFPATGGGKTPQIGTKAQPGPLYGVSSHAWPALGVAVTVQHQMAAA